MYFDNWKEQIGCPRYTSRVYYLFSQMVARSVHWALLIGFSVPPIVYSAALQDPAESERLLREVIMRILNMSDAHF